MEVLRPISPRWIADPLRSILADHPSSLHGIAPLPAIHGDAEELLSIPPERWYLQTRDLEESKRLREVHLGRKLTPVEEARTLQPVRFRVDPGRTHVKKPAPKASAAPITTTAVEATARVTRNSNKSPQLKTADSPTIGAPGRAGVKRERDHDPEPDLRAQKRPKPAQIPAAAASPPIKPVPKAPKEKKKAPAKKFGVRKRGEGEDRRTPKDRLLIYVKLFFNDRAAKKSVGDPKRACDMHGEIADFEARHLHADEGELQLSVKYDKPKYRAQKLRVLEGFLIFQALRTKVLKASSVGRFSAVFGKAQGQLVGNVDATTLAKVIEQYLNWGWLADKTVDKDVQKLVDIESMAAPYVPLAQAFCDHWGFNNDNIAQRLSQPVPEQKK